MLGNGMSFSNPSGSMFDKLIFSNPSSSSSLFGQDPFNTGTIVDIQSLAKPGNLLSKPKGAGLEKFGNIMKGIADGLMYMTAAMPGPSQQGAASLLAMSNAQKEKDEDRKTLIQKLFIDFLKPKSEMGKMAADFGMTPEQVAALKKSGSHPAAGDPYAPFMMPLVKTFAEAMNQKIKGIGSNNNKNQSSPADWSLEFIE